MVDNEFNLNLDAQLNEIDQQFKGLMTRMASNSKMSADVLKNMKVTFTAVFGEFINELKTVNTAMNELDITKLKALFDPKSFAGSEAIHNLSVINRELKDLCNIDKTSLAGYDILIKKITDLHTTLSKTPKFMEQDFASTEELDEVEKYKALILKLADAIKQLNVVQKVETSTAKEGDQAYKHTNEQIEAQIQALKALKAEHEKTTKTMQSNKESIYNVVKDNLGAKKNANQADLMSLAYAKHKVTGTDDLVATQSTYQNLLSAAVAHKNELEKSGTADIIHMRDIYKNIEIITGVLAWLDDEITATAQNIKKLKTSKSRGRSDIAVGDLTKAMYDTYKNQLESGTLVLHQNPATQDAVLNLYKRNLAVIEAIKAYESKAGRSPFLVGGGMGVGKSFMARQTPDSLFYSINKGKDASVTIGDLFGFDPKIGVSATKTKGKGEDKAVVSKYEGMLEQAAREGKTIFIDEFFDMTETTANAFLDILASGRFVSGSTNKEVDFYANGAKLVLMSRISKEEARAKNKITEDIYNRLGSAIGLNMQDLVNDNGKIPADLAKGLAITFLNNKGRNLTNPTHRAMLSNLSFEGSGAFTKGLMELGTVRNIENAMTQFTNDLFANPDKYKTADGKYSVEAFDMAKFKKEAFFKPEFETGEEAIVGRLQNIQDILKGTGNLASKEGELTQKSKESSAALQQQDEVTKAKVKSIKDLCDKLKNLNTMEETATKTVKENASKTKKKAEEITKTPVENIVPKTETVADVVVKEVEKLKIAKDKYKSYAGEIRIARQRMYDDLFNSKEFNSHYYGKKNTSTLNNSVFVNAKSGYSEWSLGVDARIKAEAFYDEVIKQTKEATINKVINNIVDNHNATKNSGFLDWSKQDRSTSYRDKAYYNSKEFVSMYDDYRAKNTPKTKYKSSFLQWSTDYAKAKYDIMAKDELDNFMNGNFSFASLFNIIGRSTKNDAQLNNSNFSSFFANTFGGKGGGISGAGGIASGDNAGAKGILDNVERSIMAFRQTFGYKLFAGGMKEDIADIESMLSYFLTAKNFDGKTGSDKLHTAEFKEFILRYKGMFDEVLTKVTQIYGKNTADKLEKEMNAMIADMGYNKGMSGSREEYLLGKGPIGTILTGTTPYDRRNKATSNIATRFGGTEYEWLLQTLRMAPNTYTQKTNYESTFFKEIKNNQTQSVLGNMNNFYYRMKQLKEELPEIMQLLNTTVTKVAFSFSRLAFGVQVIVMNMALLKTAFIGTFGYALNKSIEFTKSLVEQTEKMQRARITLTGIFGKERSNEMVKFAKEYAVSSPATFEEITNMIKSFGLTPQIRNMLRKKTGNELKNQMKDLADITVALGMTKPEQGTAGAMFSLREALAGQWRSLKMRFEIVPEAVAASIGKTVKEIEKSPELLTKAFKEFWRISLGEDTLKSLAETVKVQVANIYDFIEQLGQKIGESGFYKHLQTMVTNIAESFKGLLDTEWIDVKAKGFSDTLIDYSNTLLNTFRDFSLQVMNVKGISPDIQNIAEKRLAAGDIKPDQINDYMKNSQLIKSTIDTTETLYKTITGYTKEMSGFALSIAKLFSDNSDAVGSFIHDVGRMGKEIVNMFIIAGGYYAKLFSWIANIDKDSKSFLSTLLKITLAISMVFPIASANIFINAGRIFIEVLTALTKRDLYARLFEFSNKLGVASGSFVNMLKSMAGITAIQGTKLNISDSVQEFNSKVGISSLAIVQKIAGALKFGLIGAIIAAFTLGFSGSEGTFTSGIATLIGIAKKLFTSFANWMGPELTSTIGTVGFVALMFPEVAWLGVAKSFKWLTSLMKGEIITLKTLMYGEFAIALGAIAKLAGFVLAPLAAAYLMFTKYTSTDVDSGVKATTLNERKLFIQDALSRNGGELAPYMQSAGLISKDKDLSAISLQEKIEFQNSLGGHYNLTDEEDPSTKFINYAYMGVLKDDAKWKEATNKLQENLKERNDLLKKFADGSPLDLLKNIWNNPFGGIKSFLGIGDYTASGYETLNTFKSSFDNSMPTSLGSTLTESTKEQTQYAKDLNAIASDIIAKDRTRLILETTIMQNQLALNPTLALSGKHIESMVNNYKKLADIKDSNTDNQVFKDMASNNHDITTRLNAYSSYYTQTKEGKIEQIKADKEGLDKIYKEALANYNKVKNELNNAHPSLNGFQDFLNYIIDRLVDFLTKIKSVIQSLNLNWLTGNMLTSPLDSAINKLTTYKSQPLSETDRKVGLLKNQGDFDKFNKQIKGIKKGMDEQLKSAGGGDKAAELAKDYARDMKKLNKEFLEATNQTTRARIQGAKDEYTEAIKSYEEKYKGYVNYETLMTKAKKVEEVKRNKAMREAYMEVYGKIEKNQFIGSELRQKAFEEVQRYELEKELTNIYSIAKTIPEFKDTGMVLAKALQEGYKETLRENAYKMHEETYKNLIGNGASKIGEVAKDNYFMNSLNIGQRQQMAGYQTIFSQLESRNKLQAIAVEYQKSITAINNLNDNDLKNLGTTKDKLKELQAITFEMQRQAEILKAQKELQELQLRQHNDFKGAFKFGFEETVKGFESGFDVMKKGGEELATNLRSGLSDALTKTIMKDADSIKEIWQNLWKSLVQTVVKALSDVVVNNLMQSMFGFGKQGKSNAITENRGADDLLMTLSGVNAEAATLQPTFTYLEQSAQAAAMALQQVANTQGFLGGGETDIFGSESPLGSFMDFDENGDLVEYAAADGGIVSAPTRALIGEGKYTEAVVPMPNGKAIPVENLDRNRVKDGQPSGLTIINITDKSLFEEYLANNPDAVVNVISADTLKGGKTYQALKAKQSK